MSAKRFALRGPGATNSFSMSVNWGSRLESPAQIAERLSNAVKSLSPIHPLLRTWWFADPVAFEHVAIDEVGSRLANLVKQGISKDDDDEPDPSYGYSFSVTNTAGDSPQTLDFRGHVGGSAGSQFFGNGCVVSTAYKQVPDPAIVAYPVFKAIMMALVRTWGATSASAICSALWDIRHDSGRSFAPAWMTYLAPPLASRITPPSTVPCETTPDGGVLMIAAEDTFDVDNPAHRAGAWAINDALVSLTRREL